MSTPATVVIPTARNSVMVRMAERFGVDAAKLQATLKATAFKGDVSDAQFMALMIVADQYKLNPLTREVFAFPDKNNGIVPVVSVDGWSRIVNEHPQFDGLEFVDGTVINHLPEWIECVIYRKDRSHPVRVREYMAECKRTTGPWTSHPRRMLRHKAMIQCARLAFGFVGIYEQDEAERIVQGEVVSSTASGALADINLQVKQGAAPAATERQAPPAADERHPLTLDGEAPTYANTLDGPSYAEVREYIDRAEDRDDVDAAEAMINGVPAHFRGELRDLVAAKREKLAE